MSHLANVHCVLSCCTVAQLHTYALLYTIWTKRYLQCNRCPVISVCKHVESSVWIREMFRISRYYSLSECHELLLNVRIPSRIYTRCTSYSTLVLCCITTMHFAVYGWSLTAHTIQSQSLSNPARNTIVRLSPHSLSIARRLPSFVTPMFNDKRHNLSDGVSITYFIIYIAI